MKKNNVFNGIVLILIAIVMMGSAMGYIPDIPWFKIVCSIGFLAWAIKGLFKRDFFSCLMGASFIAWLFDEQLGIEDLAPFPLLFAAALLGIGLNMIFGKKKIVSTVYVNGKEMTMDEAKAQSKWEDGREVVLKNIFGQTSKYVNSSAFSDAKLQNVFGSANVYFNNAMVAGGVAKVNVDNVFGQINIYFPKTWRANIKQNHVFGKVNVYGEPNRDMDAPYIDVDVDNAFGQTNIYFE